MLELWGIGSTPLVPSLPDQLWPGVVAPNRVLSMGQIELNCTLTLNWVVWNRTVLIYHHHHVVLLVRISLILSRHFFLSFIASDRSSGLHPVSSHSYSMYVRAGRPAFARPYVGVHRSTSLMSSSLETILLLKWFVSIRTLWLNWIAWNRIFFDN